MSNVDHAYGMNRGSSSPIQKFQNITRIYSITSVATTIKPNGIFRKKNLNPEMSPVALNTRFHIANKFFNKILKFAEDFVYQKRHQLKIGKRFLILKYSV